MELTKDELYQILMRLDERDKTTILGWLFGYMENYESLSANLFFELVEQAIRRRKKNG